MFLTVVLLACSSDARSYAEALEAVRATPEDAARICEGQAPDCVWSAVERLATSDPEAAAALCPADDGECWFILAEKSGEPERCAQAGPYEDDCRLHLLSARFDGADEASIPGRIESVGLAPEDPRPWQAWYRHSLGRQRPLDRPGCATAARPEACRSAALGLFNDRLNAFRDRGADLCQGLPEALAYVPDPELDVLLENRRRSDLCDPSKRHAPPSAAP